MSEKVDEEHTQPMPTENSEPYIQDMVIKDIEERRQMGIRKYGTALQPFNGRDALKDAYEECLDQAIYLKQAMVERDRTQVSLESSKAKEMAILAVKVQSGELK